MNLELTPEEQKLQDTIDKLCDEIYSQLGIPNGRQNLLLKTMIKSYDAIIELNEKAGHVIDSETEERIHIAFKHIFEEEEG